MSKKPINYKKDLTFKKVWATIHKNHQKFQDNLEKLTAKYDAIFDKERQEREERRKADEERRKADEERRKADEEQRKADEVRRRKADEEQRKADEERRKADEEQRKDNKEHLRKLQETVNQTSRDLNKNIGALSNTFGTLIEHLLIPNIVEKFNELGYHFDAIWQNGLEILENQRVVTEIDVVLENEKTIALVEIKSKPNMRDVKDHLERMSIARRFFERRGNADKELIGVVAGAVFPNFVKQFAIESGFYVLTQTGDTVKIDVPENFKPRIF
ncbi:MAG: hypothetical protein LBE12_16055 [Planctomycetaceae bacterium]|jgi:hypothetical protein|nr:hypothetical protein [Planctomycetaceae bacterium]